MLCAGTTEDTASPKKAGSRHWILQPQKGMQNEYLHL